MRRRAAIQTARGAVLASHAAAGVALGVSKEAERLLRSAEGLIRSAVAFLELAGREAPQQRLPRAGGAPGAAGGAPGDEGGTKPQKKKKKKKKGKKEKKDCENLGERTALAPSESCLADEWADGPQHSQATTPAAGARGGSASSARTLKPHSSRERSPPPRLHKPPQVGGFYSLRGLTQRPSLNGLAVSVTEHSAARGRWAARLPTGEDVWVLAEALAPLLSGGIDAAAS